MGGYGALAKMGRNRDGSVNHALRAQQAANRAALAKGTKEVGKEAVAGAAAGAAVGALAGPPGAGVGAATGALGGVVQHCVKKVMGGDKEQKGDKQKK
eukprot:CAMPEP_0178433848 /NCGR_PEP_ID=MMETSP0689_2-20121128/33119_1 /TAXON_ID=160604 /ORGANISM="Amphidinium massartii, Strain CS-259" /LENGTH=97 /DNA_ID=CAMNT_0020055893 /DNA_START=107 /DNA_END=400 /DNA_ORIENTATION=-